MFELLVRAGTVSVLTYAPPWLVAPLASPRRLLAAEYAVLAALLAVVALVTRADMRKRRA